MDIIIAAISCIVAIICTLSLAWDVLKTAYAKIKHTQYEWKTSDLFQSFDSWVAVLVVGFLLFFGWYNIGNEYARVKTKEITGDMTYCDECSRKVPVKYINEVYGDLFCPDCTYSAYKDDMKWYKDALDMKPENGAMVVELVVCDNCLWFAPENLYDKDGNNICIDCVRKALHDNNVYDAIWNYYKNS